MRQQHLYERLKMETVRKHGKYFEGEDSAYPMILMNQFLTPSDSRVNLRQWKRDTNEF